MKPGLPLILLAVGMVDTVCGVWLDNGMTNGIPPIEERLAMKRIPWRSFSNAELEEVGAAAYLRGNIKLLTAVRREVRKRSLDDRPWADGSTRRISCGTLVTDRSRFQEYRDRLRGGPARAPEPCGTYAAFRRHQRAGEEPCRPCREAYNAHQREMYKRRKG